MQLGNATYSNAPEVAHGKVSLGTRIHADTMAF
jgi:hypothetical protein